MDNMTNSTLVSEAVMQCRFVMEGVLLPSVAFFGLFGKNNNILLTLFRVIFLGNSLSLKVIASTNLGLSHTFRL